MARGKIPEDIVLWMRNDFLANIDPTSGKCKYNRSQRAYRAYKQLQRLHPKLQGVKIDKETVRYYENAYNWKALIGDKLLHDTTLLTPHQEKVQDQIAETTVEHITQILHTQQQVAVKQLKELNELIDLKLDLTFLAHEVYENPEAIEENIPVGTPKYEWAQQYALSSQAIVALSRQKLTFLTTLKDLATKEKGVDVLAELLDTDKMQKWEQQLVALFPESAKILEGNYEVVN